MSSSISDQQKVQTSGIFHGVSKSTKLHMKICRLQPMKIHKVKIYPGATKEQKVQVILTSSDFDV
ncbi:unnamed protein product [Ceratitis capitata]|uniref:(Mediterranean fruit fly) hypothetical protein n=1 Tax=Ceratitis capitata TaxID=7213 RepID=A0A811UAV1_CERCA|nr:unnamed protein product [Ceratitis capitata]